MTTKADGLRSLLSQLRSAQDRYTEALDSACSTGSKVILAYKVTDLTQCIVDKFNEASGSDKCNRRLTQGQSDMLADMIWWIKGYQAGIGPDDHCPFGADYEDLLRTIRLEHGPKQ